MSCSGIIFDINEATVHDGPGLRTAVFLKGCPLRCAWCHSPEGQSPEPEMLLLPDNTRRLCGKEYNAEEFASYLRECASLTPNGGITFTGGEVLMQMDFMRDLLIRLRGIHITVETSGAGRCCDLLEIAGLSDLIYFGLKIINPEKSVQYVGRSSDEILHNLFALDSHSSTKYILRIPLIPGAIATEENFLDLMNLCRKLKRVHSLEFLKANKLAPAKYLSCNRQFPAEFASCETGSIPEFFDPGIPFVILD